MTQPWSEGEWSWGPISQVCVGREDQTHSTCPAPEPGRRGRCTPGLIINPALNCLAKHPPHCILQGLVPGAPTSVDRGALGEAHWKRASTYA